MSADPQGYEGLSGTWLSVSRLQNGWLLFATFVRATLSIWLMTLFLTDDVFRHIVTCGGIIIFNAVERLYAQLVFSHGPTWQSLKALHDRIDRRLSQDEDELWNVDEMGPEPAYLREGKQDDASINRIGPISNRHWGTRVVNKALFETRLEMRSGGMDLWNFSRLATTCMSVAALSWPLLRKPYHAVIYIAVAAAVMLTGLFAFVIGATMVEEVRNLFDPAYQALRQQRRQARKLGVDSLARRFAKTVGADGMATWEHVSQRGALHATASAGWPELVQIRVEENGLTVLRACLFRPNEQYPEGRIVIDQFVDGPWVAEMAAGIGADSKT